MHLAPRVRPTLKSYGCDKYLKFFAGRSAKRLIVVATIDNEAMDFVQESIQYLCVAICGATSMLRGERYLVPCILRKDKLNERMGAFALYVLLMS